METKPNDEKYIFPIFFFLISKNLPHSPLSRSSATSTAPAPSRRRFPFRSRGILSFLRRRQQPAAELLLATAATGSGRRSGRSVLHMWVPLLAVRFFFILGINLNRFPQLLIWIIIRMIVLNLVYLLRFGIGSVRPKDFKNCSARSKAFIEDLWGGRISNILRVTKWNQSYEVKYQNEHFLKWTKIDQNLNWRESLFFVIVWAILIILFDPSPKLFSNFVSERFLLRFWNWHDLRFAWLVACKILEFEG